jgi:hypothetical protein
VYWYHTLLKLRSAQEQDWAGSLGEGVAEAVSAVGNGDTEASRQLSLGLWLNRESVKPTEEKAGRVEKDLVALLA